jgi:hypothetical protein
MAGGVVTPAASLRALRARHGSGAHRALHEQPPFARHSGARRGHCRRRPPAHADGGRSRRVGVDPVEEAMIMVRHVRLTAIAICTCMSASLASFPRQSAAAELITLTPGPAIQKFTVSFSIAKPALQPPKELPRLGGSMYLTGSSVISLLGSTSSSVLPVCDLFGRAHQLAEHLP